MVSSPLPSLQPKEPPQHEELELPIARGQWHIIWRRFRRDRVALAGLAYLIIIVSAALLAGVIARLTGHSPNDMRPLQLTNSFGIPLGPNRHYWFGADTVGRDVFIRVIYGARTSLTVAFLSTTMAVVVGTTFGLLSGYHGGKTDLVVSRIVDVVISLPVMLLALGLAASCGLNQRGCAFGLIRPGLLLVSYIIGLFTWPFVTRIVRAQVFSLRESEFVEAARSQGASSSRIVFHEILPNVLPSIIVYTTLLMPANMLFEASLSFLGVGVPASTPSWGKMVADGATLFTVAWWLMLFPGLMLFFTVLSINLVGDGLQDALNPRQSTNGLD